MFVVVGARAETRAFFLSFRKHQTSRKRFSCCQKILVNQKWDMRNFTRSCWGIFFLVILVWALGVQAKDSRPEITWIIPPNSSLFKTRDSRAEINMDSSVGAYVAIHKDLAKRMPAYQHNFQLINIIRVKQMLQAGRQLCSLMILETTDREEQMVFGPALSYILPAGLILNKPSKKYHKFVRNDVIDFSAIIATSFRLGVVAGRTFGSSLDGILSKVQSEKVFKYYGESASKGLMEMLRKGRVDGVMAFYGEALSDGGVVEPVDFFLVQENQDLLPLRVSCSKSEWGNKVVAAVVDASKGQPFYSQVADQFRRTLPPDLFKKYQSGLKKVGMPLVEYEDLQKKNAELSLSAL
ncbi:hypothetical protein D3C87_241320 [compost metagenome]